MSEPLRVTTWICSTALTKTPQQKANWAPPARLSQSMLDCTKISTFTLVKALLDLESNTWFSRLFGHFAFGIRSFSLSSDTRWRKKNRFHTHGGSTTLGNRSRPLLPLSKIVKKGGVILALAAPTVHHEQKRLSSSIPCTFIGSASGV